MMNSISPSRSVIDSKLPMVKTLFFTSALHDKLEPIFIGIIPAVEAFDRHSSARSSLFQILYKSLPFFGDVFVCH